MLLCYTSYLHMKNQNFQILPITAGDRSWIFPLLKENWGSLTMVSRGRYYNVSENPGFTAKKDGQPAGLITYEILGDECEITSLQSMSEGEGIGSALITAVKEEAEKAGCKRLVVLTTNDNAHAFRFYQKRGFTLSAVHPNSMEAARKLKPEIPLIGMDGIPMRDEIEFEMVL